MTTTTVTLETPIGLVRVSFSASGVREIQLDPKLNEDPDVVGKSFDDLSVRVVKRDGPLTDRVASTITWMEQFFSPTLNECPAPEIDNEVVGRDNFTGLVLRTLMADTSPGATLSYSALACRCGSPKACRAVGQAMRANPCPLVVPCHRVVASNGGLGHYMSGKGDNIKSWLLELEKRRVTST